MHEIKRRMDFASSLIKETGRFLLSHQEEGKNVKVKKANDYVTKADGECERLLVSGIQKNYPSDSILGEEGGSVQGSTAFRWIIDPIDGTVNFMNGFPLFTISIGLEQSGKVVGGLVYVPMYDELFHAIDGEGSYLNEEEIHVSSEMDAKHTLALCVPPHRQPEMLSAYIEREKKIYEVASDVRSIGSAALSLCYVASGRCSLYYELNLHLYDIAAGIVILKEAGGEVRLKESKLEDCLDVFATVPQHLDIYSDILEWSGSDGCCSYA